MVHPAALAPRRRSRVARVSSDDPDRRTVHPARVRAASGAEGDSDAPDLHGERGAPAGVSWGGPERIAVSCRRCDHGGRAPPRVSSRDDGGGVGVCAGGCDGVSEGAMKIEETADGTIRVVELDPTKWYWLIVDRDSMSHE